MKHLFIVLLFSFQAASYMIAVSSASPPTKQLVAVGVMFSRGEHCSWGPNQPTTQIKCQHFVFMQTLYFRCSDGMDRHRQEWLDYSCSEDVRLDYSYMYSLSFNCVLKKNRVLFRFVWTEQRRNLWWLLQGFHCFLYCTRGRGHDTSDSRTKRL